MMCSDVIRITVHEIHACRSLDGRGRWRQWGRLSYLSWTTETGQATRRLRAGYVKVASAGPGTGFGCGERGVKENLSVSSLGYGLCPR